MSKFKTFLNEEIGKKNRKSKKFVLFRGSKHEQTLDLETSRNIIVNKISAILAKKMNRRREDVEENLRLREIEQGGTTGNYFKFKYSVYNRPLIPWFTELNTNDLWEYSKPDFDVDNEPTHLPPNTEKDGDFEDDGDYGKSTGDEEPEEDDEYDDEDDEYDMESSDGDSVESMEEGRKIKGFKNYLKELHDSSKKKVDSLRIVEAGAGGGGGAGAPPPPPPPTFQDLQLELSQMKLFHNELIQIQHRINVEGLDLRNQVTMYVDFLTRKLTYLNKIVQLQTNPTIQQKLTTDSDSIQQTLTKVQNGRMSPRRDIENLLSTTRRRIIVADQGIRNLRQQTVAGRLRNKFGTNVSKSKAAVKSAFSTPKGQEIKQNFNNVVNEIIPFRKLMRPKKPSYGYDDDNRDPRLALRNLLGYNNVPTPPVPPRPNP